MYPHLRSALLASAMLLSVETLTGCVQPTPVGTQTSAVLASEVTAQVVSVSKAKRQVTLRGANGRTATLDVPPDVRNFSQIMPGDTVRLTYRARIDALVTGAAIPITGVEVTVAGARAEAGQMPAGIVGARTRRTVQVVSVDPTTHTVTFREPDGSIDSITAVNPANFAAVDGLRPGTNVLVTVTQAVAVSVDKV
jgi:hypothetical protein